MSIINRQEFNIPVITDNICVATIILKNSQILMGHRHYQNFSVWNFPGGRVESGETIIEALHREIKEEIGIQKISIEKYLGQKKGSYQNDVVYFFHCLISEQPKLMEPEKFSEWRWFDFNNLPIDIISLEDKKFIEKALKNNFSAK